MPHFSLVIPAHNEAAAIQRTLAEFVQLAQGGELEVIVVSNGCTDDTATRARAVGAWVRVLETPVGSKSLALNLGDHAATAFPRFYVDADVRISAESLRKI